MYEPCMCGALDCTRCYPWVHKHTTHCYELDGRVPLCGQMAPGEEDYCDECGEASVLRICGACSRRLQEEDDTEEEMDHDHA